MSGRVQWRRFNFFDKDVIGDNISSTLNAEPTCGTAEGGLLLLGDSLGNITLADRNFKNISWTHKAFSGPVRGVAYVFDAVNPRKQYVICIGEELNRSSSSEGVSQSANDSYVIKVFGTANLAHPIQAFHAATAIQGSSALTNFAVTSNGFQIVAGFSCGSVVLFSGNFLADGSSGRQYVPQILLQNHRFPISGLHFCELHNSSKVSSDRYVRLYVVLDTDEESCRSSDQQTSINGGALSPELADVADAGILVFDTSYSAAAGGGGAISRVQPRVLDFRGSTSHCSSLMKHTSELVVGREEGVFSYSIEDRGGAAGFEGKKQCISAVGRYVLVGCVDERTKRTNITIYDLRNKFISMSHLLQPGETVSMVYQDGGVAYVLTSSWSLIRFREKETSSKLDVLLRKNLYPLAISLAAEEQADVSEIMSLYKLYADNLYKKNDFDGAITQYCHTIGFVQPSYVIRRFLDTQRIGNLILYLEKLHERGIATKDHTTLLLTCYTKTNNEKKLSEFCKLKSGESSSDVENDSKSTDVNFDVLTAIQALHSVGFDEHALKLAISSGRHEEFLSISLTSPIVKNTDRALSYLVVIASKLETTELVHLVTLFSSVFLAESPAAFTGLMIQLCTGFLKGPELKELFQSSGQEDAYVTEEKRSDDLYAQACSTVLELPTCFPMEEALNLFADNDTYLRIFLEGVSEGKKNQILPPKVIELLLEVYLVELKRWREELSRVDPSKQPKNSNFVEVSRKIKTLEDKILLILDGAIASTADYDLSQALLLMHSFQFESGELFLLEKMHSSDLILQKYIESGNEKGIMRVLRREGRKDPELYLQVLTYFVELSMNSHGVGEEDVREDSDDDDEKWDLICEVLSLIEKERILTPMQVVPILSLNPDLPLYIASRFLKKALFEACDDLAKVESDVSSMRMIVESVAQERAVAKQLKESSHSEDKGSRQLAGTFTSYDELDDEDDFEAQQAEAEREVEKKKWANIKKAQIERTGDHESFFAELENSNDGFSTVAAYFGKTIVT